MIGHAVVAIGAEKPDHRPHVLAVGPVPDDHLGIGLNGPDRVAHLGEARRVNGRIHAGDEFHLVADRIDPAVVLEGVGPLAAALGEGVLIRLGDRHDRVELVAPVQRWTMVKPSATAGS